MSFIFLLAVSSPLQSLSQHTAFLTDCTSFRYWTAVGGKARLQARIVTVMLSSMRFPAGPNGLPTSVTWLQLLCKHNITDTTTALTHKCMDLRAHNVAHYPHVTYARQNKLILKLETRGLMLYKHEMYHHERIIINILWTV